MRQQHMPKRLAILKDPFVVLILKRHKSFLRSTQTQSIQVFLTFPFKSFQKDILFCDLAIHMDKYLILILMFLIAGMGIAITRDPPVVVMFYTMLGGAVFVIIYSAMKDRKARKYLNKSRKSKK